MKDDTDPPPDATADEAGPPAPRAPAPLTLEALSVRIAELFAPDGRDVWRARIDHRVRQWLGRPDARLLWTLADDEGYRGGARLVLPGREHPPRALALARPLGPEARTVWNVLRTYLATAVAQMEGRFDTSAAGLPLRWRGALTERQLQVAELVCDGHSNERIAELLGVAPRTVVRLVQEVFKKLGYSNRAELAAERALGRPPTPPHQRVPDGLRLPDDDGGEDGGEDGGPTGGGGGGHPGGDGRAAAPLDRRVDPFDASTFTLMNPYDGETLDDGLDVGDDDTADSDPGL